LGTHLSQALAANQLARHYQPDLQRKDRTTGASSMVALQIAHDLIHIALLSWLKNAFALLARQV
jgi:hypothetical protein